MRRDLECDDSVAMSASPSTNRGEPNLLGTVLLGGLLVGVVDGLDAIIFSATRGVKAARIFQYIAGAVLGPATSPRGNGAVALGVALHFAVAFALTAGFVILARLVPKMKAHWLTAGVVYGLITYALMNYVIVPLTRIPPRGGMPSWPSLINGILAHVFCVGVPMAYVVWVRSRKNSAG
jgi:hypothetical protein